MYLDSAKKEEIFEKYGKGTTDTGSAESQIALFTYRISHLTEHMKQNRRPRSGRSEAKIQWVSSCWLTCKTNKGLSKVSWRKGHTEW